MEKKQLNKKNKVLLFGVLALVAISLVSVAIASSSSWSFGLKNDMDSNDDYGMFSLFQGNHEGMHSRMGMNKDNEDHMGINKGHMGMSENHEEMEKIMEEGTYEDFLKFAENNDFPMASWVDSPEKFSELKEHHEEMEQNRESTGHKDRDGGCSMMDE